MTQLLCPRCSAPLSSPRDEQRHDCFHCQGTFADRPGFDALLGHAAAMLGPAVRAPARAAAACPRGCGTMQLRHAKTLLERVAVDVCGGCGGAWLDIGEAAFLRSSAVEIEKAAADPVAYARRRVADIDTAHAEVPGIRLYHGGQPLWGLETRNTIVRSPVWTWTLCGLCFAAAGAQLGLGEGVLDRFAMSTRLIVNEHAGFERLVTSMFLHADVAHLVGNMLFLSIFGDDVEDRLGRWAFPLLYLTAGLAATGTFIASAPDFQGLLVGASGAISGLLGAYLVLFPHKTLQFRWRIWLITAPAWMFLLFWFGYQLVLGAMEMLLEVGTGHVAWWAHIGGFSAGVLLAGCARRVLPDARVEAIAAHVAAVSAPLGAFAKTVFQVSTHAASLAPAARLDDRAGTRAAPPRLSGPVRGSSDRGGASFGFRKGTGGASLDIKPPHIVPLVQD